MKRDVITKSELTALIAQGQTIWEIAATKSCAMQTVRNYMKRYDFPTPKGFYNRPGKKPGRRKGFHQPDSIKNLLREKFTGEGNPFYGRRHSESTRRKMSERHADISGNNNPFRKSLEEPGRREAHQQRCKEIWAGRDETYRAAFSEKLSKAMAASTAFQDGKLHKHHRAAHYMFEKAGRIFCRSSWEFYVARALNRNASVKRFTLEEFTIPYIDETARKRRARIDFLVYYRDGRRVMIEVKPSALATVQHVKMAAYKAWCVANGVGFVHVNEDYIRGLVNEETLSPQQRRSTGIS